MKLAPSAVGEYFCPKCDAFVADSKVVSQVDCKVSCPGDAQSATLKASAFQTAAVALKALGDSNDGATFGCMAELKIDVNLIWGNSCGITKVVTM